MTAQQGHLDANKFGSNFKEQNQLEILRGVFLTTYSQHAAARFVDVATIVALANGGLSSELVSDAYSCL
jgi:hypothetical protein